MVAIGLGLEQVKPYLLPGVLVGCENSATSVTLTGDKEILKDVTEKIKKVYPDALARVLQVDRAYHSRKLTSHPLN